MVPCSQTWHATNNVDKLYAARGSSAASIGQRFHWMMLRSPLPQIGCELLCICICILQLPLFARIFALCLLVHISSDILLIYAFYALDMQFSCCCYSCRLLLMTSSLASCSIPQVVAAALSALLRLVCCRLSRDIYYV